MSSIRHYGRNVVRALVVVATTFGLVALGSAPSSARPDPGPSASRATHAKGCLLQRVDAQLVRCDDLTGNGVTAPAFITER